MDAFYTESQPQSVKWENNMHCAVYVRDLKQWCRGQISRIVSETTAEVISHSYFPKICMHSLIKVCILCINTFSCSLLIFVKLQIKLLLHQSSNALCRQRDKWNRLRLTSCVFTLCFATRHRFSSYSLVDYLRFQWECEPGLCKSNLMTCLKKWGPIGLSAAPQEEM